MSKEFQTIPKFGDWGNSEPAKQGEITVNTYLDVSEFNKRSNDILLSSGTKPELDNRFIYPYGKLPPTKKTFSVKENEVALMSKKGDPEKKPGDGSKFKNSHKWYNQKDLQPKHDNYAHVFNSLNGIRLDMKDNAKDKWEKMPDEERKALIRKDFRVVGTIGTSYNYESKIGMPYFPTRIGGVFAMQNGSKPVTAGQFLMIDAPLPDKSYDSAKQWKRKPELAKLTDIPDDKVTMEIVPFDANEVPSWEVLEYYLSDSSLLDKKLKEMGVNVDEDLDLISSLKKDRMLTMNEFLYSCILVLKSIGYKFPGNYNPSSIHIRLLRRLVDSFFMIRAEQHGRIFAKALTDAPPGAQVDVFVTKGYNC
jgi:hypothetical protein